MAFQGKEQIVVIKDAVLELVSRVAFSHGGHVRGVGDEVGGLAAHQLFEVRFLVAAFAQEGKDGLGFGKGALAFADIQLFLAGAQGGQAVRGVHDREARFVARRRKTAQDGIGETVKGTSGQTADAKVQQALGAAGHFLGGFAGEGQQQDLLGRHALFDEPGQAVNNGAGFARAGPGHHQQRPVQGGGGLVLGRIEFLLVIDNKRHGVSERIRRVNGLAAGLEQKAWSAPVFVV